MPIGPDTPVADDQTTLDYGALLDEVMGLGQSARFPAQRQTSARRWIGAAYAQVWAAADWTFKKVYDQALHTVDAGNDPSYTPVMPPDFLSLLNLYDDLGFPLYQLTREELQDNYRVSSVQGQTGRPEAFAVVNRRILLGPRPDADYTFTIDYNRRMSHRDPDGTVVAGFFADNDLDHVPLWDDHNYILVPRAQVIGLKSLNDPTWGPLDSEYQSLLGSMVEDYVDYGRRQFQGDPDH